MNNSTMMSEGHCLRYTTGSEEGRLSAVNCGQLRKDTLKCSTPRSDDESSCTNSWVATNEQPHDNSPGVHCLRYTADSEEKDTPKCSPPRSG